MKNHYPIRQCLHWLFALYAIAALATLQASAQTEITGTIRGHVFVPATGEYLRNAEVHLAGTNRTVQTGADGSFEFSKVAAGSAAVEVNFTGYETATLQLNVTAGAIATAEMNLKSVGTKAEEGPIKMEAFTVATEREGNAKAIQDQKQAMTVSNIVAAETFNNTAEGNVGEFLKYLPGIQLDYVEADARNPRIRGLPAQYTTVTYEGMDLASADGFIQNNGTDNGGGAGVGGRSFGFEQVAMSSIDAVEVNFTTDASMGAGAAAGNIDLHAKHAFSRSGQRISFDFSEMGNSEELFWKKIVKPDDRPRRLIVPNFSLEYSNSFLDRRLGIFIGVSESNFFNEQRQFVPTYDTNFSAADPRPIVLTKIQYKDGPKLTEKSTLNFTVDFKATPNLLFSLVGSLNNYGMMTSNRSFGFSVKDRTSVQGDGWTTWSSSNLNGSLTNSWSYLRKRTHGYSYIPTFQYKINGLTINGALDYSVSENNYAGAESQSMSGSSVGGVSLSGAGISVTASRPADNLYGWRVIETAGPDWSNLANFKAATTGTAAPTFGFDGRYNRYLKIQGRVDARYATSWTIPTWFKTGANVEAITFTYRNPTNWNSWNYIGPGGGLGGNWALYPSQAVFSQGHGGYFLSTSGGTPAIADHDTLGALFETHPEYFVHNDSPTNLTTAFNNDKFAREQIDALYGMFDTKPIRRLEFQAGVRWERTRDELVNYNPLPATAVAAAGFPVAKPALPGAPSAPTTVAGVMYQYLTNPRTATSSRSGALFPSAGVKYSITRNVQAHFGYSYTTTRAAFSDIAGSNSENDTTQDITIANPGLKPEYSNNYTARIAYYFEPVGSFAVGVFENDIKNAQNTVKTTGIAADYGYTDPLYMPYTVSVKVNVPGTLMYRGATVEYQQALSFLPKPFNGLSVFTNYTRIYDRWLGIAPALLKTAGPPYNYGWVAGIPPHTINAGITYKIARWHFGLKGRWVADTPTTSTYNTWLNQNTKLDADVSYNFARGWTVYFNSRNITNVPDHTFVGKNRQQIGGGRAYEYYGSYLYAGIKATF